VVCVFVGGWWSGMPTLSYDKYVLNIAISSPKYLVLLFCLLKKSVPYSFVSSLTRQFLSKVEEKFPKDADLIVACQRGLR
jgi:hypothetical protein